MKREKSIDSAPTLALHVDDDLAAQTVYEGKDVNAHVRAYRTLMLGIRV